MKQHQKILDTLKREGNRWLSVADIDKLHRHQHSDLFVGYELNTRVSDLVEVSGEPKRRNKTGFVLEKRQPKGASYAEYRIKDWQVGFMRGTPQPKKQTFVEKVNLQPALF